MRVVPFPVLWALQIEEPIPNESFFHQCTVSPLTKTRQWGTLWQCTVCVLYLVIANEGRSTYTCSFCWHCWMWLNEQSLRRDLNIRSHDRLSCSHVGWVKRWCFSQLQVSGLLSRGGFVTSSCIQRTLDQKIFQCRLLYWATACPRTWPSNKFNRGSLVCLISSKWSWYALTRYIHFTNLSPFTACKLFAQKPARAKVSQWTRKSHEVYSCA